MRSIFALFAITVLARPIFALHPVHNSAPKLMKDQLQYSQFGDSLGIANDCNETPITYSDLESIATSAEVTNQMDFLKVLNRRATRGLH